MVGFPCFIKVKDGWVQERLETLDFQAVLVGKSFSDCVTWGRHRASANGL